MTDSNQKTKHWLVLAHCFNLDGRAASQTITDRIPLLINKGVVPVVLSAPHGFKDHHFPHYRVISPAPSGILFETRHIIKNNIHNPVIKKILKSVLTILILPFLILEKLFVHLDSHWSWFITASAKGCFLVQRYRPELIYSTAGPFSTHVAGFILHKIFHIHWIAELHDPLIYDKEKHKWQMYLFKKWLEKRIFKDASAVIYFTEKALDCAVRRNQMKDKGHVLRPGAAPPDISGIRYKKRNKIHFGHFGSLAEDRSLKVVIQAIYELLEERPEFRHRVCLDVYGSELDPVSVKSLSTYSLDGVICQHGRIEYDPQTKKSGRRQVMEAMRQSDVLLLIHGEGVMCQEYIPSKLYEYLLTYRPILGLVERDSELETFLVDGGHYVALGDDVEGVKNIMTKLIAKWESDGLPDYKEGSPFTVEASVDNLMNIVKTIG